MAFSLVELLMALLVASLLMAALAPVMTRKFGETVAFEGSVPAEKAKSHEINYGVNECTEIKTDTDGSEYCEGTYIVPSGFNGNLKVTLIGAGGGGGTAPTAGYVEYTTVGANQSFKVPALVNNIETTLVSGGAGGGAGGQKETDVNYTTPGSFTWNVPAIARNKYALISMCGGGGGAGGTGTNAGRPTNTEGGAGGGGGYILKRALLIGNISSQNVIIGGGGGGGAGACGSALKGNMGGYAAGGGGGPDKDWGDNAGTGGKGGSTGGEGGVQRTDGYKFGLGGERGDISSSENNTDGQNGELNRDANGGTGASSGGLSKWGNNDIPHGQGGGGGGGSFTGYGGGGGGGGCGHGGGGGGGAATIFGTRTNRTLVAAGGGGGGGGGLDDWIVNEGKYLTYTTGANQSIIHGAGGGGGGGGGQGGGNGGQGARARVQHGLPGANGSGYSSSTIFGANYCNGGAKNPRVGNYSYYAKSGDDGKPGAMRITYLDYGPGGGGGGSGQIVPIQSVVVTPDETLNVQVGPGRAGGTPGKINSDGTITDPTVGQGGNTDNAHASKLLRGATVLLATCMDVVYHGLGTFGGSPTGTALAWTQSPWYGAHGGITGGLPNQSTGAGVGGPNGVFLTVKGFSNTNGGGSSTGQPGGIGGRTELFGSTTHCEPGKGGTSASIAGKNATGYGGCAGGGGYSFGAGGSGTGGYARISWNKKWNPQTGEYVLQEGSTAGGGAGGNILVYSIPVKSGDRIKIRIGKGGNGAYIQNNVPVDAQNGGITSFKDLKAGGGKAGSSATIANNVITNGKGGEISTTCHNGTAPLFNNATYCTKGLKGNDGLAKAGGAGAINKYGTPGAGGIQDVSSNSNGKNATGYGAGGGGAAIRDLDKFENPSQSVNNPIIGGNGANGRIILEWRE